MKIKRDYSFSIPSYLGLLGDPEFTRSGCNSFRNWQVCRTFELRVDENPVELRVDVLQKQLESLPMAKQHAIFGCFQK